MFHIVMWLLTRRKPRSLIIRDTWGFLVGHTLWLFNIAMENAPTISKIIYQWAMFHRYVKAPDGSIRPCFI